MTIYNSFLVPLLLFLLRALSPFIPKWKATLHERNGLLERWRTHLQKSISQNRVLVHVSSVGELEQILPVLQEWQKISEAEIYTSYFSPSVPQVYKDWSFAAYTDYLPLDREEDVREFLDIVQPQILVLNRYDLWPNLMATARRRGIPIVLANASTPPRGKVGAIGLWLRHNLFAWISAWTFVDSVAAGAWEPYMGSDAVALVTGNPRVDRAVGRALVKDKSPELLTLIRKRWVQSDCYYIVAGSTWAPDEHLLLNAFEQLEGSRFRLILVPHEPTMEQVSRLQKLVRGFGMKALLLSELETADRPQEAKVLIADALGILSELYSLGHTAFVGGGFGKSVHSVIEPAAHRLPVAFGPKHERMPEARTLELMGGGYSVQSDNDVSLLVEWFRQTIPGGKQASKAREAIDLFLRLHRNAGERVAVFLEEQRRKAEHANSMVESSKMNDIGRE